MDKVEESSRTNPPLRNDQHPLLAITLPTQPYVVLFDVRVAVIRAESSPDIFTQAVNKKKGLRFFRPFTTVIPRIAKSVFH